MPPNGGKNSDVNIMNGDVRLNKTFTLREILDENEDWLKAISRDVWDSHVKKSPNWKRLVDLNNRLEAVEIRLNKVDGKIDLVLIRLNGGDENTKNTQNY